MIRKFKNGFLCLRNNDVNVINLYPKISSRYRVSIAGRDNQVFVETNLLLAPRALADWSYNE